MKNKNLSELSIAELNAKEKSLKTVLGAFMGILSVFVIALILLFMLKQYTVALPLVAVFFSLSSILFISKKQLKDIKTEIEARSENGLI